MRYLLILMFLLPATVVFGQSPQALDKDYGFGSMTFGTSPGQYDNLKLTEDYGDTKFYQRTDTTTDINGNRVYEIDYGFYKGKLYTVLIKVEGKDNSRGVLSTLQQKYGHGEQERKKVQKYNWQGNKVAMDYTENELTNDATITLYDKDLWQQKNGGQ